MRNVLKILLASALMLLVVFTFYSIWKQSRPVAISYDKVKVEVRDIEEKMISSGTLGPRFKMSLAPGITGILDRFEVNEGDHVLKGDVVARIRIIPDINKTTQAQDLVRKAEIELEQAQREADLSRTLFEKGVVSRESDRKAQSALKLAQANLDSSKSMLEVLIKGAADDSAYSSNIVRSTMNGTILSLPIKPGESVSGSSLYSQGTIVAVIADMDDIVFEGYTDEADVVKLKEGMNVELTLNAIPDTVIPAILEYVASEGETRNGAKVFKIRAAVSVPEGLNIRSGYSAKAEIVLSSLRDALTIDESCIEFDGDCQYVYKLVSSSGDDQVWEKTEVRTGLSDGIHISVLSGLGINDIVRGKAL